MYTPVNPDLLFKSGVKGGQNYSFVMMYMCVRARVCLRRGGGGPN